jgi:multidrug efflux pump subunit AcrA (membrane-fusion protein)
MHFGMFQLAVRFGSPCLLAAALVGCESSPQAAPPASPRPQVQIVKPELRTIVRTVSQPAFVNAFEQTSIYPKIAGYIKQWTVDIGDRIKKDQCMAELFVPELAAELAQKQAQAAEQEVLIKVAEEMVKVSENRLKVATAQVTKAKADIGQYQSAVERWESEVERLTKLVEQRVVDRQVLSESEKQLKSNVSAREAAQAGVLAAQALEAERRADLAKSHVDVDAARAKYKVIVAEVQRYAALVSYTRLMAPYNGIVVVRNANTGDFVQPAGGDQSAERASAGLAPGKGAPIYVVSRTDLVRIFVDIPEGDANYVRQGTKAKVNLQALDDGDIEAAVTRTSWSLNVQTRTLRAEIDLPNPQSELLPGMYANCSVVIERPNVRALPIAAILPLGNQNCCYLLVDGKAMRTLVQTGPSDGKWIEVAKKKSGDAWSNFQGDERVILGDFSEIRDGEPVEVAAPKHGE